MRWLIAAVAMFEIACAQVPDVRFRLDITLAYQTQSHGPTSLRLYDPLGRTSTLGLTFFLEPGLRAYASERLQHIPGDPDKDLLDEYYVEDQGLWRVGKQYLPFGSGTILRESVLAARGDTNLILENLPVAVAACDGGPGAQRGIVGRIGGPRLGVSGAVGDHFGIAATALDLIRRPEQSPGLSRGWKHVLGFDASRRSGIFLGKLEFVWLKDGETDADHDVSMVDVSETIEPNRYLSATVGWTRKEPDQADYYRVSGSLRIVKNGYFEPMIRYLGGRFYDLTLAIRVRL